MCELAVKSSDWIMVDKWEVCQSDFCLQHEVLQHFGNMFSSEVRVMYVCGSDLVHNMSLQHLLKDPFGVVCAQRPEFPIFEQSMKEYAKKIPAHLEYKLERVSLLKKQAKQKHLFVIGEEKDGSIGENAFWLEAETSSTLIRSLVAKKQWEKMEQYTFASVVEYMKQNCLFEE